MYNGRIFGTIENFFFPRLIFCMSCLTMMRSVTECFIVLIRKGIGWLSLKRGCAAFTTTASIFLLSWSQIIQKIALNQNWTNYLIITTLVPTLKKSRNLYALAMTRLFCPKCDKKCNNCCVSSTENWYWFTNNFVAFFGTKMNENWLWSWKTERGAEAAKNQTFWRLEGLLSAD